MKPEKVFEILMRENADMLWAFIRSLVHNPGPAEDLFQETFVTAWRNLDHYDATRPFGPWLRGIAAKLVLAHRRKSAREAASMVYCDEDTLNHLEGQFRRVAAQTGDTWSDKLDALRRCLARLGEPHRHVIELHYQQGLSCEEIAARVGQNLEAIKKRLQRARSQLTECLLDRLAITAESHRP